jgi:hypothetical protein
MTSDAARTDAVNKAWGLPIDWVKIPPVVPATHSERRR